MRLAAALTLLRWWRSTRRARPRACDYCTAGPGQGHDFDCETRQQR